MNLKYWMLMLMAPADGEGSDLGGGEAVIDRGDEVAETEAAPTVDDDLAVARGADGKFAKKTTETPTIPKPEFDRRLQKEREAREVAERQLAELQAQRTQAVANADVDKMIEDVKALRAEERKAALSGDDEKAGEISARADHLNRQIAIHQSSGISSRDKEVALERMRVDLAVERIEELYPELNEDSEDYDQELTDDVLDKQRGYIERERLSPSKALIKAAKYVFDRRAGAPEKTGLKQAADEVPGRKDAAVKKNLDAAKRQPASLRQTGADSDKHGQTQDHGDVEVMTQEEFAALPESTKAKMRGDFL